MSTKKTARKTATKRTRKRRDESVVAVMPAPEPVKPKLEGLTLQVGRTYPTREGGTALVIGDDFNFFPMLPFGAKLNRPCGRVEFRLYKPNGTCGDNPGPNPEDIILPNTTNFPWADMPKWARFVAMDAIGEAFWYGDRPQARDILWYTNGSSDLIPKEYIPSWYKSLPWEQSLLERPLP